MTDEPDPDATPTADVPDWVAQSVAHQRRTDALRAGNKTALFSALAAAGITRVVVAFDGYGDSGQIESVAAQNGDVVAPLPDGDIVIASAVWDQVEPRRETLTVCAAIETLAYDCLATSHEGWENNDGAFGDFVFDVATQTITLDYNERYSDSTYSQHEF